MDNSIVAIVVIAFLGVFLGVGIVAMLCKACSLCSGSCGNSSSKVGKVQDQFQSYLK